MANHRDYDPIACVDCPFQSDDPDDFEWHQPEPNVNWHGDPYCHPCHQERFGTTALDPDTTEERYG